MSSADKLTIETPEQTLLEFPLAGIGSRFLALAADIALQILIAIVALLVGIMAIPGLRWFGSAGPQWIIAAMVFAAFLLHAGYFAFFEAVWNGQTPGKRYAQIRVIKDDGRPIGAYDAIARNLLRSVDELPGLYTVGVLSILFSKQNKRLGDYVAGTVVVHEETLEGVRPYLESNTRSAAPAYDTSRLTIDELRLIETFFSRRESLDPALRSSMAAQIARRMAEKLSIGALGEEQPPQPPEQFLASILEQYRSTGRFRSP